MTASVVIAACSLAAWIYLLTWRGGFWLSRQRDDRDLPPPSSSAVDWPAVTAVIPARNEAELLPRCLASLAAQDYRGAFNIIVVDDQSTDGTGEAAARVGNVAPRSISVVTGVPLPTAWTGKVWAMHQGVARANTVEAPPHYLLLADADIAFEPGALTSLVARARDGNLVLTSVMAKLRCESIAERALIPAFIFFFQMLYPFAWVNSKSSATAAAAGGCMLVDRAALGSAGGLAAIRNNLIDDCSLAAEMKAQGPIWLGLTDRVTSLRPYPGFNDIRQMVARSAYTQLRRSPLLLIGTVLAMSIVYIAPPTLAVAANQPANVIGLAAYALMFVAFLPTLLFYRRSPLWGLALPAIAAAYLAFTLDSAYKHIRGKGGLWKGRIQAVPGK